MYDHADATKKQSCDCCFTLNFVFIVYKSLLRPKNIERFINFLSPNSSRNNASTINFSSDLSKILIRSVGVFGTQAQICATLEKLNFSDSKIRDTILDTSKTEPILKAGIHAIMSIDESVHPTTVSQAQPNDKPIVNVVLFYWPVVDAFENPNGVINYGINRSNVSSLYLRILHEISDSVCIPVTTQEVEWSSFNIIFCFV